MAVHSVSISKDNAELSALLDEVQSGAEVVLVKAGKPVAVLVAYSRAHPFAAGSNETVLKSCPETEASTKPARKPGSLPGQIRIAPDFDVLPDEIAEAFGVTEPPLSEHERRSMLRASDKLVPKIPGKSAAEVDREMAEVRKARRAGGRWAAGRRRS